MNYKLTLLYFIVFTLVNNTKINAQASCNCSGGGTQFYWCVNDASGLLAALNTGNPNHAHGTSTQQAIVDICPLNGQPINLGDLVPNGQPIPQYLFPLVVPDYVTLQGNYNFFNYNQSSNTGTTINFPFLFAKGKQCGSQFTSGSNDMPPGGDNYPEDDEESNSNNNNNSSSLPSSVMSISEYAFVFRLEEGAQLKNLCIVGPKPDTKEQDMCYNITSTADCNGNPPPAALPAIHGMCSGVYMRGKDTRIENCEIYGFPIFGVEILPNNDQDRGDVYINRSYIHNNKGWGWGYGVWLSGGGGNMTCDYTTSACSTWVKHNPGGWILEGTHLRNSPFRDHVLHVDNTFFFENGKDFDATGDRNSVFFNHCTFSERATAGANIHRHEEADVCNDYVLPSPSSICPNVPTYNDPYPNSKQSCNLTLREVGGNRTWIWNSFFYKGQNNIELTYPNTFDPSLLASCYNPYPPGTPVTPVPFGKLTPLVHIGRDTHQPVPANRENWNYFINQRTSQYGRIIIADTDVNYWDYADPHVRVKASPQNSVMDGQNLYLPDETTAPVPMLQILSLHNPTGTPNPDLITVGDDVGFSTVNCRDAAFNMNTDMLYMWRFHETRYDHEDEIRTGSLGAFMGMTHTFNQIGITNVNLMAIDVNHNFAASTIVTKQITVQPPQGNGHVVMVVNLKDTYDGRHLTGTDPLCRTDRVDDCGGTPCNPIDITPTGFEKFIEINGEVIWSQDVAEDPGGWQRIELNIEDWVSSDGTPSRYGQSLPNGNDHIEIGIRPLGQGGADAAMVRGISFYVDDVYIQSTTGYNALANGDFEEFRPNSSWPDVWDLTDGKTQYQYPCSLHVLRSTSKIGGVLARDEVRSGHYAYWGRIRSVVIDADAQSGFPYYQGIRYIGGHTYKSVKQEFNIQAPPPRLADTTVAVNPGFTLQPNPATFNTAIKGFVTQIPPNETYTIKIIAPDGAVIYNTKGAGYEFEFNANFPPGVYFVNIQSKSFTGFKKLVVVK